MVCYYLSAFTVVTSGRKMFYSLLYSHTRTDPVSLSAAQSRSPNRRPPRDSPLPSVAAPSDWSAAIGKLLLRWGSAAAAADAGAEEDSGRCARIMAHVGRGERERERERAFVNETVNLVGGDNKQLC